MGPHKKLIIVFDLDQTIGYFTQFAIFMDGLESYIKRKLKRDELFKLFDLYPQIFRPKMMELFKYLEKMKKRPGVHSKNASKGQTGYKNVYRGQGK